MLCFHTLLTTHNERGSTEDVQHVFLSVKPIFRVNYQNLLIQFENEQEKKKTPQNKTKTPARRAGTL